MPIPGFQELMLPILTTVRHGEEYSIAGLRPLIASQFQLTEEELRQKQPSGVNFVFANRLAWANIYLERAGLVEKIRRGNWIISPLGLQVLNERPGQIDVRFLKRFPGTVKFTEGSRAEAAVVISDPGSEVIATPQETLESAYAEIRKTLAAEILQVVNSSSPKFFEKLVVDLMLKMGYGGDFRDAGSVTGGSGDQGIDGMINEDRLGLDVIYLQAKRWQDSVGRPELHRFVGALHGKRARKGVFITTSTFTREAKDYVESIDPRVVLIDGSQLAEYMIDFGLGVSEVQRYSIARIDSDYFVED
jgi:restriction system protein